MKKTVRTTARRTEQTEIALQIVVEDPMPGVTFALQLGSDRLAKPTAVSPERLVFDFTARLGAGTSARPRLLGRAVQGPPEARFVYINSGLRAGQPDSIWERRAKVPLAGITRQLIKAHLARPRSRLQVRIPGVGRDGGPICATVPLADGAWRVISAAAQRIATP
jgi:hypothetical protein